MVKKIKMEGFYEISILPDIIIKASIVRVPTSEIKLDPRNVRFSHIDKKLTDKEMETKILDESETNRLCLEIDLAGGLRERPLIDSKLVVREGSRRIACYRRLKRKYKNNPKERKKWESVQCIMLPEGTEEKYIALYLAGPHITGKSEWNKLSQASHIYDLYYKHRLTYEQIRSSLRMGKKTIIRIVKTYRRHSEYGKKYRKDDRLWLRKYSYFLEFLRRGDLKEWSTSEDWVQKFMDWLKEGKFRRGEQVRELHKILRNKEALNI